MSLARFVWALGGGVGGVVVAGAAFLSACSSSSQNGFTQTDSGTKHDSSAGSDTGTTADSGSSGSDTGSTGQDSGGSGEDSGGTCTEKPPSLYVESTPGVYCPFSAVDGGSNLTCAAGQHCCETPEGSSAPSTCEAAGTACPVTGSIDWQCEEAIDCTAAGSAGPICCGTGSPTTETCGSQTWAEWTGFTGTKCATSCPAPGITVCEQNSDCTGSAGSTCTPSKADGNSFGFCQ